MNVEDLKEAVRKAYQENKNQDDFESFCFIKEKDGSCTVATNCTGATLLSGICLLVHKSGLPFPAFVDLLMNACKDPEFYEMLEGEGEDGGADDKEKKEKAKKMAALGSFVASGKKDVEGEGIVSLLNDLLN